MTYVTVSGLIATTPRHIVTEAGLDITSFRLAESMSRFDATQSRWVAGETNWYTVTAQGSLAKNMVESLSKGDRIFVEGSLRIRDWDSGEGCGTSVEIEAENVGHNQAWGTSQFTRNVLVRPESPRESVTSERPAQQTTAPQATAHSCNCRSCNR